MVEYLKKPIVLTVIICIVLFYSGILQIPERNPFHSLFPKADVVNITGQVLSSPVKSSSGKTYSCKFSVKNVVSKGCGSSEAVGNITVYIPTEMVEAYFPGKLYSPAKN